MNIIFSILSGLLQLVGLILITYHGWIGIVLLLLYLIWQNRRREQWVRGTEQILLSIEVPKDNDKKELSAEQMFASLHGILRPKSELLKEGSLQEHVSFEVASIGNQIQFFVWCPKHLKDFVEGQIYAQYPTVRIREGVEDYANTEPAGRTVYGAELTLTKTDVLPIKTFTSFEVDPLAGITAVLAKLDQPGEEMWIQVLARPIEDEWQSKGHKYIDEIKSGKSAPLFDMILKELTGLISHFFTHAFNSLSKPPEPPKKEEKKAELSTGQQGLIKAVEEKITKLGYQVKIRICYLGPNETLAKQRLQAIVGGFKQFNTTNLNGFTVRGYGGGHALADEFRARLFLDPGDILNIEELASLYHLPHTNVATPNIIWANSKTGEPPANLPSDLNTNSGDISLFAQTNFRGVRQKFGIKRTDRGRHLYIVGQTGTGKSKSLELLTLSDIYHNHGFAIVDPHGDYAQAMLQHIPPHRVKDVVYFNPADTHYPIAFNPLEMIDANSKNNVTSELIGVLKRMFDSWGPRLEHILRFTILALLDTPNTTLLGITRMLTDKNYRKIIVANIKDPVVRSFWVNEFAGWNDKFASEAVAPVLNKVGAFVANPLIRNIVGQTKSTVNLRQLMDEGKILVVNLSRGLVGEDNAAILGALMVTKIQLAAMSRANVTMEQRRPFYLYVDEFQNFATDSFAVILSEARKYQLNLTVANQFIAQIPDTVKDAVFGNVGSMITFRVGATDASYLARYFEPTFDASDLTRLNNQDIFISMMIDGEKAPAFSGHTLIMPDPEQDLTAQIVDYSRHEYAVTREQVEAEIEAWSNSQIDEHNQPIRRTEGGHPTQPEPEEQKPNTFLGGLKNPTLAPAAQSVEREQPAGGSKKSRSRNRNRNKSGERHPQHHAQPSNPAGGEPLPSQPAARVQEPNRPATASEPAQPSQSGSGGQTQTVEPGEVVRLR